MVSGRKILILGLPLAVATVSSACSDSTSDPAHDGSFDASPDATLDGRVLDRSCPAIVNDAPLGADEDGSTCSMDRIWTSDSATLRLTTVGGMRTCPTPLVYEFSPAKKTLSRNRCFDPAIVAQVVHLSDAENDRLRAEVTALRVICHGDCLFDSLSVQLAIVDASGCVQRAYEGNNYVACPGSTSLPPYIEHGDLDLLGSHFRATADAICSPEGGASDLGTCDAADGGLAKFAY